MSRIRIRAVTLAVLSAVAAFACGTGGGATTVEQLAADQTLSWSTVDDVTTLDPGHASAATDAVYIQEVFSSLYRTDNSNRIVPDLATGMPDVSADGRTYTIKLNKSAKFSNGDPLTSKDVLYSWNRSAALNDSYASTFDPIVGGSDTESGKTKTMAGLTAVDDRTVKVQLTNPAGYFLSTIAGPGAASIVDRKAVEQGGEDSWWQNQATAIGSGPFKMTARQAKVMMEFAPVANWWGGSTGALKKVHVDIGIDESSAVKKFESGAYGVVGIGAQTISLDDVLRYKSDPPKSKLLTLYPSARTTWLGYNWTKGPFAPKQGIQPGDPTSGLGTDAGHDGRLAFSEAIDRNQLVDVACAKGATCTAATGGYITKGLKGYLGDNQDPTSKFDPAAAKSLYQKWDPDGSKVKGLQLRYNASAAYTQYFSNIQSQLKINLGVSVELAPSDFPTLIKDRNAKNAILYRDSWLADYDNPQDWFDNLWNCGQAAPGKGNASGYCNPTVDRIVQKADAESIDQAIPDYVAAQKMLVHDVYGAALSYGVQPFLVQSYVKGGGYIGLNDYRWEGIRILKH
jgi:oligopeptide transport system substrate-binding protein